MHRAEGLERRGKGRRRSGARRKSDKRRVGCQKDGFQRCITSECQFRLCRTFEVPTFSLRVVMSLFRSEEAVDDGVEEEQEGK